MAGHTDVELQAALDAADAYLRQPDDGALAEEWEKWMELQVAASTVAGCVQTVVSGGQLDREAVAEAGLLFDGLHRTGWHREETAAWCRVRDLLLSR
ncbi:hypothetical protein ACFQ46_02720 [Kineococcus sp. GCM10028916]|uniref:hypothetical protein n=1 Tax=Kineococcus sp. GCM10028916 TaxID=3273394 RepID=UPI0036334E55